MKCSPAAGRHPPFPVADVDPRQAERRPVRRGDGRADSRFLLERLLAANLFLIRSTTSSTVPLSPSLCRSAARLQRALYRDQTAALHRRASQCTRRRACRAKHRTRRWPPPILRWPCASSKATPWACSCRAILKRSKAGCAPSRPSCASRAPGEYGLCLDALDARHLHQVAPTSAGCRRCCRPATGDEIPRWRPSGLPCNPISSPPGNPARAWTGQAGTGHRPRGGGYVRSLAITAWPAPIMP